MNPYIEIQNRLNKLDLETIKQLPLPMRMAYLVKYLKSKLPNTEQ